jgi:hypothetical protein
MANKVSNFLLEEYKRLHESLYKSNDAIVTAIRFAITLLAAFSGALVVAIVKKDEIDKERIVMAVFGVSIFFFAICLLGSFFLLTTFKNVRRMFRAINAIRSYYVSVEKIPKEFVIMPTLNVKQPHRIFGGWPAMYLAVIFATVFLLVSVVTGYLIIKSFNGSIRGFTLCFAVAIIFLFLHGRFIEKSLKKTTLTKSFNEDTEISIKNESKSKTEKDN